MDSANPNDSSKVPAPIAVSGEVIVPQVLLPDNRHASGGAPAKVPSAAMFPSAAELMLAFRHRWALASLVGLLIGGGLFALVMYLRPAQYTATALLRVSVVEPQLLPGNRVVERGEADVFQRTQMALVKTRPVLVAALQKANVSSLHMVAEQSDPVSWLEDELKVNFIEGTELLKISLSGDDPRELADIVNAVKQTYLENVANQDRKERMRHLDELEKVLTESNSNLRGQRAQLSKLAEALKTADPKEAAHQQRIAFEELAAMRTEHFRLMTDLHNAEIEVAINKAAAGQINNDPKEAPPAAPAVKPDGKSPAEKPKEQVEVPDYLVEGQFDLEPSIQAQNKEIFGIEATIHNYESTLKDGAVPDFLKHQLKTAKEALAKTKEELRPTVVEKLRRRIEGQSKSIGSQQLARYQTLEVLVKKLDEGIEGQRRIVANLGKDSFELEMRRAEIEQYQKTIDVARQEKDRLSIELQSTSQRITDLQPAEIPERRNIRTQLMSAGLAGFWGMVLGIVGVSYREFCARRIRGKDDVAQQLNLRVLGSLPIVAGQRTKALLSFGNRSKYDWNSALRESVDALRTTLMRNEATQSHRLLMVTSPRSGEGKTTLSVLLASSIARCQRKTLLVDGDLHHPSVHRLFDLSVEPGFSEVLHGEAALCDVVQSRLVEGEELFILPAGRRHGDSTAMLCRRGVEELFAQLRQEYEYVIFDTAPVLPVVDALLVGSHMDGVLLSVRPQLSQLPELQDACERLRAANISIMGTILNGMPVSSYAYDYQYTSAAEV